MEKIMDDNREIESLSLDQGIYKVGGLVGDRTDVCIIKQIRPYTENGEMSKIVWFAVYIGDYTIAARVNSKYVVAVNYNL